MIMTSARDDVEDESLTRLATSDADESAQQTLAVLADALSNEGREVSEAEVERWLDFQRWLMIDAPYRVCWRQKRVRVGEKSSPRSKPQKRSRLSFSRRWRRLSLAGEMTAAKAAAEAAHMAEFSAADLAAAEAAHVADVCAGEMTPAELADADAVHVAEVSAGEMSPVPVKSEAPVEARSKR